MPILGFILACTVILASGLFGISAVLNAPPPAKLEVASEVTREVESPNKEAAAFSANRERVAASLTSPVTVKRESAVSDQPAMQEVSMPGEVERPHSENVFATPSTAQFLGQIMSVPASPSSAGSPVTKPTPTKSEDVPVKADKEPTPNSEPKRKKYADKESEGVLKQKEPATTDSARRPVRQNTKRKALAKRAPIPSKEELDELIGFIPSQEVVVYRTIE